MFKSTNMVAAGTSDCVYACGFSIWKKPIVRRFFAEKKVVFVNSASCVPSGATLVVWSRKPIFGNLPDGVALTRLEDGFLRSVGLGADLVRPLSWVADTRGMYFDATRPSDLEVLLQTNKFSKELLKRACRFRERIVSTGLTKYNVGMGAWKRPDASRRVILVPGQVENDASLRFGAPGIRTNFGLLKAVREAHLDAYVLYKPHPDVVAGLKAKGESENNMAAWCDEVVADVSMGELLPLVDEVHVLTSLAGFEALLRNKKVTCYGQPFYAGWGLTEDFFAMPRRTRTLTLDQLVAGALLLYPRYVSSITGGSITPEQALDDLLVWRGRAFSGGPAWYVRLRRLLLRSLS